MATPSAPFVPRDVFRLLVRLEAQKTHDVDAATLERRFRVPSGYAKDETLEQRERKAQTVSPGPGAYETPERWASPPDASRPQPTAAFASRASRDPFQLEPLAKHTATSPRAIDTGVHKKRTTNTSAASVLDVPPPLGSFARADRNMLSTRKPLASSTPPASRAEVYNPQSSSTVTTGVRFDHAPRATSVPFVPACALGPAQYNIKRLWDMSDQTGRATRDAPASAVFSVSTEKRRVVWSPARALPSNAVADTWDASPHYAKHKRRVQRERLPPQAQHHHQQQQASLQRLAASASTPSLGAQRRLKATDRHSSTRPQLDPFDWLRQQPQGEQRVNALTAKHGLVDCVRPLTAAATTPTVQAADGESLLEDTTQPQAVDKTPQRHDEDEDAPLTGNTSRSNWNESGFSGILWL